MIRPTLLMTRPETPARSFVGAFKSVHRQAFDVIYTPLIGIDPLPCDIPIQGITLLLFTSVNGVEQFTSRTTNRKIPAICVGETTKKAAIAAGMLAERAAGTAQNLLATILKTCDPETSRLLYVRGAEVSYNLLSALQSAGFSATEAILYQQTPLPLSHGALKSLAEKPVVIPVFSANGARVLLRALEPATPHQITVLCISPKVAEHFNGSQITKVHTADNPTRADMINALAELL